METPELDHQLAIINSGESHTLTRFFDWLDKKGYYIAEWVELLDENDDGTLIEDSFLMRVTTPLEYLLAEFFSIDLNKIEEERRAILEELRNK
jgi:hypothetical protein